MKFFSWSYELEVTFIDLWQKKECLCDVSSKAYGNGIKRDRH